MQETIKVELWEYTLVGGVLNGWHWREHHVEDNGSLVELFTALVQKSAALFFFEILTETLLMVKLV